MEQPQEDQQYSRRRFLMFAGMAAGSLALEACGADSQSETVPIPEFPTTNQEPTEPSQEGYALHDNITATVFWIGEAADESNDFISNVPTAWDDDASQRFGGYDGAAGADSSVRDVPRDEHGIVTEFTPLHNPFYFALPAAEFDENGLIEGAREQSPWADEPVSDDESLFKGRWVQVTAGENTVFAQWMDVGPNSEDDYGYVFGDGSQQPKNDFGLRAGIDLSPAAAISLGFDDGGIEVSWQFVDAADVPDGPWSQYPPIDNKTHWE
jgi:hypothetical protein